MRTRIVLCDVDGVLADFVGALCRCLRWRGYPGRETSQIRHWDLQASLSPDEFREMPGILGSPTFCINLEWYEGARGFLSHLQRDAEVFAVTAPYDGSPTWERQRKDWLTPFLERKRVLFVPGAHKRLVRGDVLIEDHPTTCNDWVEMNPGGIAILIDRPWNQPGAKEYAPHSRVHRAKSYADALTTIREHA